MRKESETLLIRKTLILTFDLSVIASIQQSSIRFWGCSLLFA